MDSKQLASLLSGNVQFQDGYQPGLLSPYTLANLAKTLLLPGDIEGKTNMAKGLYNSLKETATLPGRAYSGELPMFSPDPATGQMHTSPQAIEQGMNFGLNTMLGNSVVPDSIALGEKATPAVKAAEPAVSIQGKTGVSAPKELADAMQGYNVNDNTAFPTANSNFKPNPVQPLFSNKTDPWIDLFHGTDRKPFAEFDTAKAKTKYAGLKDWPQGHWFTDNLDEARVFGGANRDKPFEPYNAANKQYGRVTQPQVNTDGFLEVDWKDVKGDKWYRPDVMNEFLKKAQAEGYPGVKIKGIVNNVGSIYDKPTTNYFAFDSARIRHKPGTEGTLFSNKSNETGVIAALHQSYPSQVSKLEKEGISIHEDPDGHFLGFMDNETGEIWDADGILDEVPLSSTSQQAIHDLADAYMMHKDPEPVAKPFTPSSKHELGKALKEDFEAQLDKMEDDWSETEMKLEDGQITQEDYDALSKEFSHKWALIQNQIQSVENGNFAKGPAPSAAEKAYIDYTPTAKEIAQLIGEPFEQTPKINAQTELETDVFNEVPMWHQKALQDSDITPMITDEETGAVEFLMPDGRLLKADDFKKEFPGNYSIQDAALGFQYESRRILKHQKMGEKIKEELTKPTPNELAQQLMDLYHGTDSQLLASGKMKFDLDRASHTERGVFMTPYKPLARDFGKNVIPLKFDPTNSGIVDLEKVYGHKTSYDPAIVSRIIKEARAAGLDSVTILNMEDVGHDAPQVIALNPKGKVRHAMTGTVMFANKPTPATILILGNKDEHD